jgi:hypothetical protein
VNELCHSLIHSFTHFTYFTYLITLLTSLTSLTYFTHFCQFPSILSARLGMTERLFHDNIVRYLLRKSGQTKMFLLLLLLLSVYMVYQHSRCGVLFLSSTLDVSAINSLSLWTTRLDFTGIVDRGRFIFWWNFSKRRI